MKLISSKGAPRAPSQALKVIKHWFSSAIHGFGPERTALSRNWGGLTSISPRRLQKCRPPKPICKSTKNNRLRSQASSSSTRKVTSPMIWTLPKCSPLDSMNKSIGYSQITQMRLASRLRICTSEPWKWRSTLRCSSRSSSSCSLLWLAAAALRLSKSKSPKEKMIISVQIPVRITSRLITIGRSNAQSTCQNQCLSQNANLCASQSPSQSRNPSQSVSQSQNLDQSQSPNHSSSTSASAITISWTSRLRSTVIGE